MYWSGWRDILNLDFYLGLLTIQRHLKGPDVQAHLKMLFKCGTHQRTLRTFSLRRNALINGCFVYLSCFSDCKCFFFHSLEWHSTVKCTEASALFWACSHELTCTRHSGTFFCWRRGELILCSEIWSLCAVLGSGGVLWSQVTLVFNGLCTGFLFVCLLAW